jgi:hypothetical protein
MEGDRACSAAGLIRPRVQVDAPRGMLDHYRIKLGAAGYRLV